MTTSEPQVTLNGLYPIGEASRLLGINRDTLLRHTKMGIVKCSFSRSSGRKRYEGRELIRYWRLNA